MATIGRIRVSNDIGRRIEEAASEGIGKDMLRRGLKVETASKIRLAANPKRIDTGRLRASIATVPVRYRGTFGARVGTNVKYALFVHEGTGLYGPRHRLITPTRGRVLRFVPKGSAAAIYRPRVRGMRANPFLRDGLKAARD